MHQVLESNYKLLRFVLLAVWHYLIIHKITLFLMLKLHYQPPFSSLLKLHIQPLSDAIDKKNCKVLYCEFPFS